MIDENLDWESHIKLIQCNISKVIGVLFKGSLHLNKKCLSMIYFALMHLYINYGNVAWTSTFQTKLKKIVSTQEHAVRIIFREKEAYARPLLKEIHALNVYCQILPFMQKVKNTTIPRVFSNTFEEIERKYPTCFSKHNFKQPPACINYAKYSISYREPQLRNILSETEKTSQTFSFLKLKSKKNFFLLTMS